MAPARGACRAALPIRGATRFPLRRARPPCRVRAGGRGANRGSAARSADAPARRRRGDPRRTAHPPSARHTLASRVCVRTLRFEGPAAKAQDNASGSARGSACNGATAGRRRRNTLPQREGRTLRRGAYQSVCRCKRDPIDAAHRVRPPARHPSRAAPGRRPRARGARGPRDGRTTFGQKSVLRPQHPSPERRKAALIVRWLKNRRPDPGYLR
jgi:hypothetical protein